MTKRIAEAGTITAETDGSFPVILIEEGPGNTADYPREFFTQTNADALARSLSFPRHPEDLDHPEKRPSTDAIGSIDKKVVVAESADGKMQLKSRFLPAKSKPEIGPYIAEYGDRLGVSIYIDSDGHNDPATGRWIAESLNGSDPYKSVDLVIAGGARGRFERLSESLGLLDKTSATAEEKSKEIEMDSKEIGDAVKAELTPLVKSVENLVTTLTAGKLAEAAPVVAEATPEAVQKAVDDRVEHIQKADDAIVAAKLGEALSADLRARARKGEDVTEGIAFASKVLAEAKTQGGVPSLDEGRQRLVEAFVPGGNSQSGELVFEVPGFGRVNG